MRLHCSINICFRLLTAGWYEVTKGKILSLAFFFSVRAGGLEAKLQPRCLVARVSLAGKEVGKVDS